MEYHLIFDLSIIAVILISAILAFSRGFFQEVFALFSWTGAVIISYFFSYNFFDFFNVIIDNILISKIISYLTVFILSIFFLSFISKKISGKVKNSSVGMVDRSLGFFFGITRGYILLSLCLYGFFKIQNDYPNWVEKSKMKDLLIPGAIQIISFFDKENDSVKLLENRLKTKSEKLFEKSINSHLRRQENEKNTPQGYKKDERGDFNYLIENLQNE